MARGPIDDDANQTGIWQNTVRLQLVLRDVRPPSSLMVFKTFLITLHIQNTCKTTHRDQVRDLIVALPQTAPKLKAMFSGLRLQSRVHAVIALTQDVGLQSMA